MLKGISPLLSPELLAELCRMGHGDEIVLSDAHFPAHTLNKRVLRAGTQTSADQYVDSVLCQKAGQRTVSDPVAPKTPKIARIERFAFYERAKEAYCVLLTGETAIYGNIILKKGVTPLS